jgi:hypothetical protein
MSELKQKLKAKTQGFKEDLSEKGRDFVEQGKKDAKSLQNHVYVVLNAIIATYLTGVQHSVSLFPNIITTTSGKPQKRLFIIIVAYIVSLSICTFVLKEYLNESIYFFLLVLFNEIMNYNVVNIQFSQTMVGKVNEYQESIMKGAENLVKDFSSLISDKDDDDSKLRKKNLSETLTLQRSL